ncbi:MAG: pseudouridine-5'-phosphate glycosidase [Rhizobiales bacterium]|nr:pseudouridine-5'-phosphate glycosidase [Hyphomicrobiales bacterium]NRB15324.1 pseudouridine-5'-phosphate glycosidase [Hyphomicrobiales bacterium]
MKNYLDIAPEVAQALAQGKPVVALESTIISHGMPYPQNVEMAAKTEQVIRDHGAIPATIAIMDGQLKVGLSPDDIEKLAQAGLDAAKVSRRDMAFIVTSKAIGATTVASTMIIAAMAGIKIFATGGIGGVHRGAAQSFDISADLEELANTDVAVICAGIKSILDLGLTLEYLETKGVPVIGYQTDSLPAFYARASQFNVDYNLQTPADIAQALTAKWQMGLSGGAIIANPVPLEAAMPEAEINQYIQQALQEAAQQNVKGKDTTPFLLARVSELTKGKSLATNIALVLNNAKLAAQIAIAYQAQ